MIDEDDNDDPTYTIVGGNTNGRFAIHPTTGLITSTLDYDVDQAAMPTTDIIVVQVSCCSVLTGLGVQVRCWSIITVFVVQVRCCSVLTPSWCR